VRSSVLQKETHLNQILSLTAPDYTCYRDANNKPQCRPVRIICPTGYNPCGQENFCCRKFTRSIKNLHASANFFPFQQRAMSVTGTPQTIPNADPRSLHRVRTLAIPRVVERTSAVVCSSSLRRTNLLTVSLSIRANVLPRLHRKTSVQATEPHVPDFRSCCVS